MFVGGDEGSGGAMGLDPLVKLLFDVQPFHHHLQDPIAVGHFVQVVVKVARFNPARKSLAVDGGGLGFQ